MAFAVCTPVWLGQRTGNLAATGLIVPMLVLSVLAHELGHVAAALRRGLTLTAIRLYPAGGEAVFVGLPQGRRAERQITIAGPLVGVLLGLLCLGVAGLLAATPQLPPGEPWSNAVPTVVPANIRALSWTGWANLALAGMNMLPAMPLDGGHLAPTTLEPWLGPWLGPRGASFWVGLCGGVLGVVLWPLCLVCLVHGIPIWCPPSIKENLAGMRATAASGRLP